MPSIQQPKRAPEFVQGKQNVVTGIAPVNLLAVSFVDGNGQKSMALVLQFGKDTEDGGPGVFVMADEVEMSNQLKISNSTIKKGVRAWLASQQNQTSEEVPESTTAIETPKKAKGPAAGAPADLTKIDLG